MNFPLETIVAWAKRKWFVYPNSEIYGGLANMRDYGPYGSQLRKNIYDLRRKHFVQERDDMVGLDTTILAHPTTRQASGHLAGFSDALIDDKKTGQRFRADKIIEEILDNKMSIIEEMLSRYYPNLDYNAWKVIEIEEKDIRFLDYNVDNTRILDLIYRYIQERKDDIVFFDWEYNEKELIKETAEYSLMEFFKWKYGFENLSPEAWGNEGMHAFILGEKLKNPTTGKDADWTEVRQFNLMLNTHLWPVADDANKVYMRPETCQSLFTDFKNVLDTTRMRIPFWLAQIGKAFRNEITPGQFMYRTREFEQMEIEYFVPADADEAMKFFEQRKSDSMNYRTQIIGISPENLRFKDHDKLAHYAAAATDVEYRFPRGFGEVQGVHNRTDFDLRQHQEYSKQNMQYNDPKTGARYIPRCIEASTGLGRQVMVTMLEFYDEEVLKKENSDGTTSEDTRIVVRFPFQLAPVKYAILPLMEKDDNMVDLGRQIFNKLKKRFNCEFDLGGAIGKRYRRQDEIGTPYCICVDHQSLEDGTVTIRDRDTMEQVRVSWEEIGNDK